MNIQPLEPIFIAGKMVGLEQDLKSAVLPENAFPTLSNAYVYRERIVKREGLNLVGRLRRVFAAAAAGTYTTINGTNTYNIFLGLAISGEPNAMIESGLISPITIVFGAPINQSLTESNGTGVMTVVGAGPIQSAFLNYNTGTITITANAVSGPANVTVTLAYYPMLPVMGIWQKELAGINDEQTIFFDTKYAYVFLAGAFQELTPAATWDGADWNLFLATNYRGVTPDVRLLFVTNFVNTALNPMRYRNGGAWTDFFPIVSGTVAGANAIFLTQAKILIPYFGRLLALNVWETPQDAGGAPDYGASTNIFNRCRFSQLGDPTDQTNGWRSDIFGRGGFIDAPTAESIVSATFFKNTLIVQFESSTWQLRYVGEYGLPFLWERISADFGAESTQSIVLFDDGCLTIGDKAITSSTAVSVSRIDLAIPDLVFDLKNEEHGVDRVDGVRNFQKELVYWTYVDSNETDVGQVFPNKVLVYNYRNNTWAKFDDRVTCFGTFQKVDGVSWDSLDIFWDDMDVTWDDDTDQSLFPQITSGNSQGYIHFFANQTPDDVSYSIQGINLTVSPIEITVPNHTLSDGDLIKIVGLTFVDSVTGASLVTDLNNRIYKVQYIDSSTVSLSRWDGSDYVTDFSFIPVNVNAVYVGLGEFTFLPVLYIETKDFNPYQAQGKQIKLSYFDILADATPNASLSIQVFLNASFSVQGNLLLGNQEIETTLSPIGFISNATQANPCVITSFQHGLRTGDQLLINSVVGMTQLNNETVPNPIYTVTYLTGNTFSIDVDSTAYDAYIADGIWALQSNPFYPPGSLYAWHRFYATASGQFVRIVVTYDDVLMNQMSTNQQSMELNAMALWVRPGGKNVF